MAEIGHPYLEQLSEQSTQSTSYVDIPSTSIADTNFVNGQDYLIVVRALFRANATTTESGIRVVHGSTVFPSSDQVLSPTKTGTWFTYTWWTVWNAVSGEDINLQFKVQSTSRTIYVNKVSIFAMNLEADLTENTDWFFNENSSATTLTTSWSSSNNATKNFTPAAGDDWLVLSRTRITGAPTTRNVESRIESQGTFAETQPLISREGRDETNDFNVHSLMRVYPALGNVLQTFTEQSRLDGSGSPSRTHSGIFALNLNKFKVHANVWTVGSTSLSTTDYNTELATVSLDPTLTTDVWIMGSWAYDVGQTGRWAKSRIQIAGTSHPDVFNVNQQDSPDGTAEEVLQHSFVQNLTSGSKVIDLDASAEDTGRLGEDRSLFAVTMELAAAPAGRPVALRTLQTTGIGI